MNVTTLTVALSLSVSASLLVGCSAPANQHPAPPAQPNPGGGSEGAVEAPFDELRVDIVDAPVGRHLPALDGVVKEARV